jgi:hypothetical protein
LQVHPHPSGLRPKEENRRQESRTETGAVDAAAKISRSAAKQVNAIAQTTVKGIVEEPPEKT